MNAKKFIEEINRIFGVAFLQKAFRLVLRSAWVGGAVYLAFWGINYVWGIFQNSTVWVVFSFLAGLAIILSLFLRRKPDKAFVWRLDRRFGLKEQAYTAYEIYAGKDLPEREEEESISSQLAKDAAAPLPEIRRRVVNNGWNLRPDFESTLIVLILLLVVYLNSVSLVTQLPPGGVIGILPSLGDDPTAEEVLSSGAAGEGTDLQGQGQAGDGQQDVEGNNLFDLTAQDYEVISSILRNLGEELDDDSATSELGDSLKNQDYEGAAEEFGRLAETISQLSEDTRQEIANQFLNTAVQLQEAGQPGISAYFQQSADALYGESYAAMSESLDALGAVMQVMAQFKENQVIVDQQEEEISGLPVDRLGSDGQALEIGSVEGLDNLVSVPGEGTGVVIESTENGDNSFIVPSTGDVTESIWQSYDLSLDDVDVVSTYFSSR